MSNTSTKWIVELIDKITAPAKKVTQSVDDITQAVEDVTEAVQFNEKETKEALVNSKKYYDDVAQKIVTVEEKIERLTNAQEKIGTGSKKWNRYAKSIAEAKLKLDDLRDELQGAEEDVDHLTASAKKFSEEISQATVNSGNNWSMVATGINQTIDMVERLSNSMSFTTDIVTLRAEIQRLTDASGKDLDNLTSKAFKYSKIFQEDPYKIAQAVNAMTQRNGGSYEENFALIEKGFEKGANANHDMLDQLREYPGFFRELGLANSEAVAVMARAGKSGIFSDKAIDSLKEAQMSVTEMTQTQIDAINAVNLKVSDFEGKTAFDAIRMVSEAMKGASAQAKQQVLADIFKGAGEDASRAWIEGYASLDLDLDKIKSVKTANKGLKSFIADVQSSITKVVGDAGGVLQVVGQVGQGALGLVGVYTTLNGVLATNRAAMAATAIAQGAASVSAFTLSGAIRAVSVAVMSIPVIGWILALVAALAGLFAYFWNTSEEFRGFFYGMWEVVKLVFTNIYNFIGPIMQAVWNVLTNILSSIWKFWSEVFGWMYDKVVWIFNGIYKAIVSSIVRVYTFIKVALNSILIVFKETFSGLYNWLANVFEAIYARIKVVLDKIAGAVKVVKNLWNDFKGEAGEAYAKGKAKAIEPTSSGGTSKNPINDITTGKAPLLSFYDDGTKDEKTKKAKGLKGTKSGDKEGNMSISGSKGATSISMTINNYFTSKGNTDVRYLAEAVASKIGDRLEDAVISIG